MSSVRSAYNKVATIDWRGMFVSTIVAIPPLAFVALVASCVFNLPALEHPILDPLSELGEQAYEVYHAQQRLCIAGATSLVLIALGCVRWYHLVVKPKREEERQWANQIDYIEQILRDPDLTEIWAREGTPEQSHAERAGNKPTS